MRNKKCTIVLFEDNEDDILLLKIALKELQVTSEITVFKKYDEEKFLNSTIKKSILPDYIFIDVNLPCLSGIEILKKIKKIESKKIIFSSSDSYDDKRKSFKNGADLYIKKPNNITEYRKILNFVFEIE